MKQSNIGKKPSLALLETLVRDTELSEATGASFDQFLNAVQEGKGDTIDSERNVRLLKLLIRDLLKDYGRESLSDHTITRIDKFTENGFFSKSLSFADKKYPDKSDVNRESVFLCFIFVAIFWEFIVSNYEAIDLAESTYALSDKLFEARSKYLSR
jgi:hypothetical protein